MVESVREAHPKEQKTLQKAWVQGDTDIATLPVFKTYSNAQYLSLFYESANANSEFKDYERYHNMQDWICLGMAAGATSAQANLCQEKEPGTDFLVWGHKPVMPDSEILPYSHSHKVAEYSGSWTATWGTLYPLIQAKNWTPFKAPTTEEFKDGACSGLKQGTCTVGSGTYYDSTNKGMLLNLLFWAQEADFIDRGTVTSTIDDSNIPYDIRRATVYTQWCHKRYYRGYQYQAGQRLCVYRDIVTDPTNTSIDDEYVYADDSSTLLVGSFFGHNDSMSFDVGETGQMNPLYYMKVNDSDATEANAALIFTPQEPAARAQESSSPTNQNYLVALSRAKYSSTGDGYYLQAIARSYDFGFNHDTGQYSDMYFKDSDPWGGSAKTPRELIIKNLVGFTQPLKSEPISGTRLRDSTIDGTNPATEEQFPYQYSDDYTLDSEYDIPGVYSANTGSRTKGQAPHHAYLYQEGYHYRPGVLVTDVQELFKCKPLDEGGDKCKDIRPSSTESATAWEKVDSPMTSIPYSEQRMQQYLPTVTTQTSAVTPGSGQIFGGWFSPFYDNEVCPLQIQDSTEQASTLAENSELDPLFWNPIYSSRNTKLKISSSSMRINRNAVNWEEYTRTNFTRNPKPAFNDNRYFEYWAFLGDQDYTKIFDDKVWACEHERPELCASIPPGSLSSDTNGVWRQTLTEVSRYAFKHRSVDWKLGQLFYPGELADGTDGVYRCKPWPRSESCGGYTPSKTGAATYIWDFTDIQLSDTVNTAIDDAFVGIYPHVYYQTEQGGNAYNKTGSLKAVTVSSNPVFNDQKVIDWSNTATIAFAYKWKLPSDKEIASGSYPLLAVAMDAAYLNLNSLTLSHQSASEDYELPYVVQCRDFEDHILNDQFFAIGSYACAGKRYDSYTKGPVGDRTLIIRAFECISDFCSYNEPSFDLVADPFWRMSRAKPEVIPESQPIATRECSEWKINHPYMPGDYVCNENMVWACILDQPVKADSSSHSVLKDVTQNFPYDSLDFTFQQQHLALGCRNFAPSWFTLDAPVKWVPVKFWPDMKDYQEPEFKECVDYDMWSLKYHRGNSEPPANAEWTPNFQQTEFGDVLHAYQTGDYACRDGMVWECTNKFGCNSVNEVDNSYDSWQTTDAEGQSDHWAGWRDDNYWPADHRFSWKLTRFLPKMITPMEKAASENRLEKRCHFIDAGQDNTVSPVANNVKTYFDNLGYFAEQHNQAFNPDNHRYVPGDVVCVYDQFSGAFNVYECPPAPAGNWCCTVDIEGKARSSNTGLVNTSTKTDQAQGANQAAGSAYSLAKFSINECQVNHLDEYGNIQNTIDIGPYFDVTYETTSDSSNTQFKVHTGVPDRDPVHQNWRDITSEVLPRVSDWQMYYNSQVAASSAIMAKDVAQTNKDAYDTQNNMFRQCYEWKYVNRREQTDPRYAPHNYQFGEYACQLQRVYECLQPEFCTETEPVTNDGKIWKITKFYSMYIEDEDWNTHRPNIASDLITSDFEKIAITADSTPTAVFKFSEDSPTFKSTHDQKGRDCDPQYCYYWENGVAWMPDQYACDASNQLWQCNSRQDIAAKCTITAPVYDSPDDLDEELVWKRVEKPVLPAAAPEQIVKDCHVLDVDQTNYEYLFTVGDLVCQKKDAATNTMRVWMCIHEKRCNNFDASSPQLPWTDDYLGNKAFVPGSTNADDVDGFEPAWKLTHYIANPIVPKAVTGCVAATSWQYDYHYLMDDCVKTSNLIADVLTAQKDILWKCKRPEICALINPEHSLWGSLTDDSTDDNYASLHRRYGIGVWEPVTAWDTTSSTAGTAASMPHATSCLRGDSFPFNEPIKTGDKVCIQPTAYGPYRYDNPLHAVKADDSTKDRAGFYEQFTWDGEETGTSRTDNNGFRRVWECVGGDLCNQIYPLEDLYRHEMNAQTGMLDFVGHDMSYRKIETYEMSEAELILVGDKSETVWKLTREQFPVFGDERLAWEALYNNLPDDNSDYVFDYSNYEALTSGTTTNEVTQMTQPIFSLEDETLATNSLNDDLRLFHDFPNWFPKYERNVYEYDDEHLYMHGDFVVSPSDTWTNFSGNHKEADKIVWMCILPELCNKQAPGVYYNSAQKSFYPNYKTIDTPGTEYKYIKDFIDEEGNTNTSPGDDKAINFDEAISVQFTRPFYSIAVAGETGPSTQYRQIFIDEVWERRDHETAAPTRLSPANLNNVDKKAYVWTGPYGEHEENINGYLMNYRFKKGDHVCFTPDAVAGISQRVYECTHDTDCVEYKPYDLRVGEYFIDRFDNYNIDGTTPEGNGQILHAKNAMWSKNWPNLNRGNPWKLTTYKCEQDTLTFQASVHSSSERYLPGDFVVTSSTNPSEIYVCRQNCNQMTSAQVVANGGDPAAISSLTSISDVGVQSRWKKVYGSYDIEIVESEPWRTESNCTPISADYLPSPNFYPPDEQAGTPGGYGCFNDLIFECMHESCNDPSRHFNSLGGQFSVTNYLTEFVAKDANNYIATWLTDNFVYDPSIDQYDNAGTETTVLSKGVRRYVTVEDTNQLLWRQVRAVAPSVLNRPTEQCSPWKAGRVYVTFDLVCTRTQVYTCVNKRGCGLFDPRFDDDNTYWMERDSIPDLLNVATQPTIDCIDFDSERQALTVPTSGNSYNNVDFDYFGVEQEEAWFNEFRENDPKNMGQLLLRINAVDNDPEFKTYDYFWSGRQSSLLATSTGVSNANGDFITATDSMSNKFVDQVAYTEGWGSLSAYDDTFPTRIVRKPKFLYIQHGDYVCNDGFVYKYRQDIVNSFDWTYKADPDVAATHVFQYERQKGIYHTRNGWGALGDGFSAPEEFGATWEIQRAIPNPQVEERRVLPEVNCTYWEPYRPYLRGDIVCRFAPDNMGGLEARDYTITAYMCRIESVIPTDLDTQFDNDLQTVGFQKIPSSGATRLQKYSNHRADLCSGPVWETIYFSPSYEDATPALANNVDAYSSSVGSQSFTKRESGGGSFNDDQSQQVVVQGVSNYWIPINATPVLQTERQYTHYQSCVHPLLYASRDEDYDARRRLDTDYDDYYVGQQAIYRRYFFLPTNMWQYMKYTDDAARLEYQPSSGTATQDDPAATPVAQQCYKASSDVYLMEQKSYTVVPNWDFSCDRTFGKNYRIRYDISNPTDFPRQIQPFRNTFNGDDVLQMCAYGRVYACTSNRPCTIAFGDSTDPSIAYSVINYSLTDNQFYGYGSAAINPWLDATDLDLLGNTKDAGSSRDFDISVVEKNNYDPSLVLTRYAPFYPRQFKQLDNAAPPVALDSNNADDNECDTDGNSSCDGSDSASAYKKDQNPTPPLLSRGATFQVDEDTEVAIEVIPSRNSVAPDIYMSFYVDNRFVALQSMNTASNNQNSAVGTAVSFTMDSSGTLIENTFSGILGGKDVLVRATAVQDCIYYEDKVFKCYSQQSDPMWFRTKPYWSVVIDQLTLEKEDRIMYNLPPYKSAETVLDASDGSITVYWEKHPGPAVVSYEVYYWEVIRKTGINGSGLSAAPNIAAGTACAVDTTLFTSGGALYDLTASAGTAAVAADSSSNAGATSGVPGSTSVTVDDPSILALDRPYLKITGRTLTFEVVVMVRPVLADINPSNTITATLHTDWAVADVWSSTGSNRLGIYRLQPSNPTSITLTTTPITPTGSESAGSIKAVIGTSADTFVCGTQTFIGYVTDYSIHRKMRVIGQTGTDPFTNSANLYESALSMGNPAMLPHKIWTDVSMEQYSTGLTHAVPELVVGQATNNQALADASGIVFRAFTEYMTTNYQDSTTYAADTFTRTTGSAAGTSDHYQPAMLSPIKYSSWTRYSAAAY